MMAQMVESVKRLKGLSLAEARKTGRIQEFVSQQEQIRFGSVTIDEFDCVVNNATKPLQSQDQTSGVQGRRHRPETA